MKKGIRKKLGRIPLPRKRGGPQTTKKGKKGYNRRRQKTPLARELWLDYTVVELNQRAYQQLNAEKQTALVKNS